MSRDIHTAGARMERVVYTASGIGAIVFGALLFGGPSGFVAQRAQLAPWFWFTSLAFAVLLPLSLIAITRLSVPAARMIARTSVVGFIASQLLWVPAMTVPMLADHGDPWLQGINALPSTLAVVAWRGGWAWAVPLGQGPIVALVQIQASEGPALDAVLNGLGAVLFCSILAGTAFAVVRAADAQDEASERARAQASIDARRRTREQELGRIDAIVHDDIMSVLLTASRSDPSPDLAVQAQRALDAVTEIAAPDRDAPAEYTPSEVVALLRATAGEVVPDLDLTYELRGAAHVPRATVAALAEALAEALRNARRHAGDDATVRANAVLDDDAVVVTIEDDGRGFNPDSVAASRLGIRVSIVDRMAAVDGGAGSVSSRPGRGTWVTLMWTRR
ncbi:sensor histidine kinase [Demequina sp. SO4-18]|uniref:sensor histidine kinase n=1 Tax=Demequina sp. SO4-18 TaxID=3401026 RepID=UPI003B5C7BFC